MLSGGRITVADELGDTKIQDPIAVTNGLGEVELVESIADTAYWESIKDEKALKRTYRKRWNHNLREVNAQETATTRWQQERITDEVERDERAR